MRKIAKRFMIVGLICLLGPLFGFTYKSFTDEPGEVSQIIGIGIILISGLILACTNDEEEEMYECPRCGREVPNGTICCPDCGIKFDWDDDEPYKCPKCGYIVNKGTTNCPNCGVRFDWDDEEYYNNKTNLNSNDDDFFNKEDEDNIIYKDDNFIVYNDDYYLTYSNSLEPLDETQKANVFYFVTNLYKFVEKDKSFFIKYNDIHNRREFSDSNRMFIYCIFNLIKENDERYNNAILAISKYYVKYYTKYILKYGDKTDKGCLSDVIDVLKIRTKKEHQECEEFDVYSDKYYLDYADNLEPFDDNALNKIFKTVSDASKTLNPNADIKSYSSIKSRQEYEDTRYQIYLAMMCYLKIKNYQLYLVMCHYFVKYYTKVSLIYGDNNDKYLLSQCIKSIQEFNNMNNKN